VTGLLVCLLIAGVVTLATGYKLSQYKPDSGSTRYYFKATQTDAGESVPLPQRFVPGPVPAGDGPRCFVTPEITPLPRLHLARSGLTLRAPPLIG
jgi:hypothetical protein